MAEQWRRLKRIYFASELNGPSDFSLSTSDASFRERNSRPTNLTVRPKKTAFPHSLVNSMLKLQRVNQLTPLRHSRANFNAILSCTLFIFRRFFFPLNSMFFRENNFRKCPAYDGRPTRSTDYLVWFSPPEARKGSRAHPHSCAIIAVRRPLLVPLFYDVSAELIALYADKEVEMCAP